MSKVVMCELIFHSVFLFGYFSESINIYIITSTVGHFLWFKTWL